MARKRVLFLHGWQGSPAGHWQRWLAGELERDGHAVRFPDLPECDVPCPDRWGSALHDELAALAALDGGERVVCCHSLGCVLWIREAHRVAAAQRPDRVVLVAPPCPGAKVAELARFYPTFAQREGIRAAAGSTRLVCSDDDPYCPRRGAEQHWAHPLDLTVDLLAGQGHLNVDAGYGPWPAMREWVLGATAALAPAAAAA